MGRKVCLRCKGKTLTGIVNKLLKIKSLLTSPSQCFALLPQVNFPANNLNFYLRWRWWDQIKDIFLNLFYFNVWRTNLALRNEKKKEIVASRCLLETILWLLRRHWIIQDSKPSARDIMMTIIMIGTIFSQIKSPIVIKFFQVRVIYVSFIPFFVFCFWSLLATMLRKYKHFM